MTFQSFVQRTKLLEADLFSEEEWQQFCERESPYAPVELREEFECLLAVPSRQLLLIKRAQELFLRWRNVAEPLRQRPELADIADIVDQTWRPDQVALLERAVGQCPRSDCDSVESWKEVVLDCLGLWNAAWELSVKRGELICKEKDPRHPNKSEYSMYLSRREPLATVPTYRFLAIRRGEEVGVIDLSVLLPKTDIKRLLKRHSKPAELPSIAEDPDGFVHNLVQKHLAQMLLEHLDHEMSRKSIDVALLKYLELLNDQPLGSPVCGAVYVGGLNRQVGVAVVGQDGGIRYTASLDPKELTIEVLVSELRMHQAKSVVVPDNAKASHRLSTIRRGLETNSFDVVPVSPNAIVEAREPLVTPPEPEEDEEPQKPRSVEVASAIVMARRAMFPFESWSEVDPVVLGLAEYQQGIDTDNLRLEMEQVRELLVDIRAGFSRHELRTGGPGRPLTPLKPGRLKHLNPMVKELTDLRPGMMVEGVVTNVSDFGAFISIGLDREALVHISELSDEFVKNPADVVQIGQHVQARVLNVDLIKKRISLSLKQQGGSRPPRSKGPSSRSSSSRGPSSSRKKGSGNKGGGPPPASRSAAIAALENLFKK